MGKRRYRPADKVMEHEEAPSGFVRLYNYKEPFIKFKKGHGYEGVLLMDGSGKTVQCHLCGEWMPMIHPHHLRLVHKINAAKYKEVVGLRQSTALVSEEYRKKLINHQPPKRKAWEDFTKEEQEAIVKKFRETMAKRVREQQNERGTCPDQLIKRLRDKQEQLGRPLMIKDVLPWLSTLKTVFGSAREAFYRAGLEPRDIHSPRNLDRYKAMLEDGVRFYKAHGRPPTVSDHRRGLMNFPYGTVAYRWGTHAEFRRTVEKIAKHK